MCIRDRVILSPSPASENKFGCVGGSRLYPVTSAPAPVKIRHSHAPVSYTHLDVYKRQIQPTHSSAPHGKRPARRMSSTIPVSYTHLDVYKRQHHQQRIRYKAPINIRSLFKPERLEPVSYTHLHRGRAAYPPRPPGNRPSPPCPFASAP